MVDADDCNHYSGSYLDHTGTKRCTNCDEPIDDNTLENYAS